MPEINPALAFNSVKIPGEKNVRFYSQNLVRRSRSGYRRIRSSAGGNPGPCGGYHTSDRSKLQYRLFQYSQLDCPVARLFPLVIVPREIIRKPLQKRTDSAGFR